MNNSNEKAWYKLDNAAKIFPPTSSKTDTKVFRFSCELYETVDGDMLQSALDLTIDYFPSFRYVLKRGMFWYYLEQSELRPVAHEEDTPPCSTIYLTRKSLLFDVTWYGKRINLEVYHALTDGTGALQFLRMLVLHYLKIAHPDIGKDVNIDYDASETQQMTDSFDKYYDKTKNKSKLKNPVAYKFKGAKESEWRLNIIEGSFSTKAILNKAREYDATATVLVIALLIRAIYDEMSVSDRKKPIIIAVPVNLRNYFKSKTTRNFFSLFDIKYNFEKNNDTLEDIIKCTKECFDEHLNEEYLQARLNKFLSFERNFLIRLVPLSIKNLYMSIAYSRASREVTAAVSNVGKVIMPNEIKKYIKLFDVFTSTEKLQICICSYEDNMNITFTSPFVSTDVQCGFFRQLTQMGISVKISANSLREQKGK